MIYLLGPKAFKSMRSGKTKFSIPPGIHVQGTKLGGKVNNTYLMFLNRKPPRKVRLGLYVVHPTSS